MILDIVKSVNGVPIRLTDERWEHILDEHPNMSGFYNEILRAVENPEFITRGQRGARIAVVNLGRHRWIQVAYREINSEDGFIITAFIDESFEKNKVVWSRHN
ncbi:MAG TPA: hypothetical protein VK892_12360 [Pyrinomonadaceae bacterium]|nr:hypothetical protein [Pyrinomonadaceae bacterium]